MGQRRKFTQAEINHMTYLYKSTRCSVAQIARHFGASWATVNKAITDKLEEERKKKPPAIMPCPDCGAVISLRFPMHYCKGKRK